MAETTTDIFVNTVQALSLAKDLEGVMRIVRRVARELTGADGATFVLRDKDQCYYADEDAISPLWKGSRFPLESCISGWVMIHKEPALIRDIYEDSRIPAEAYRPTFVKSLAMVPIRKLDPIGAIGNYWANQHTPTPEQLRALQALADITAVSIENINIRNTLEQEVKDRTRALSESLIREKELGTLKSIFVSMASHEFRTPLGAILSSVTLAEKYTATEQQDKREKHYRRIKSSVRNLIDILNDFLSIDKLEAGTIVADMERFDLQALLQDNVEEVEGMRKENQSIRFTHTGPVTVCLDRKMMRNIVLNLLSNAVKYSERDIELVSLINEREILITVTDHGIGIPEAQQDKIFSKFFRASNSSSMQGTGLGLNIVKHYVNLQGGNIDFTSSPEGTTFRVRFPR